MLDARGRGVYLRCCAGFGSQAVCGPDIGGRERGDHLRYRGRVLVALVRNRWEDQKGVAAIVFAPSLNLPRHRGERRSRRVSLARFF